MELVLVFYMGGVVGHSAIENIGEAVFSQEEVAQNPELFGVLAGGPQVLEVDDGVDTIFSLFQLGHQFLAPLNAKLRLYPI